MSTQKMGFILGFLGFLLMDGVLLHCMACPRVPHVRYYDFVLQESNITRLCETRSILTVNGSFPGPTIRARKGDTIFVNVHNQGKYGVTIHWHGVKQPRNPWYDGPENVTQCPIRPGTKFTYEVILSTEEGTLWWHAHSDWSRATVHGAIIILPKAGTTYPFPKPYKEHTIILGSWFKLDVMTMFANSMATGVNPDLEDAYTINGQPGDLCNCSKETTYRLPVIYGKTYLLRMVNAVMNIETIFKIAKHTLTVVGQDGAYIKPLTTDFIMITPGQTMDILFTANQSPSHYYMAVTSYADGTAVDFKNSTATAIVQYKGRYTPPSTPIFPSLPRYDDIEAVENFTKRIRSLASKDHPISVPKNITTRIYITVSFGMLMCPNNSCLTPAGNRQSASLNNVSFDPPNIDILQAYYRGLKNVFKSDFPSEPPKFFDFTGNKSKISINTATGTKARMINYGEEVEIVFQGTNLEVAESHPMHLHGFSFYLVGTGPGNFDNATDPLSYNLVDPPLLNTINVPMSGWAAIRFVADNPGVWFLHCHLERHQTWGMDTVLVVKNGNSKDTSIRPPPAHMPPCS